MEVLLKQILAEIQGLKADVQELKADVRELQTDVKELKTDVQVLKANVQVLQADVQGLQTVTHQLQDGQAELNLRLTNVEGQIGENSAYIKAVLHRSEELDAKFDGLLNTTATQESLAVLASKRDIAELDAKINVKFELLNARIFNNETDIKLLKAVE
ncbi:hypothetical protein HSX37_14010|uniref:Uncharacterized protein n=1 Tax=Dendrosporobacter quercicolus TaxID=146817 RepID=A0A1G9WL56_9FIRM|nr:hypothetical protein [Dendrosporobacter quercicolus]NSL49145.1 hypothetical protein [Dendrosporobacter quercicolus DSM 1736]SDM85332.1 hypothetical protein SAMN04488502_10820 [Dendrosporobacter quercicolus]